MSQKLDHTSQVMPVVEANCYLENNAGAHTLRRLGDKSQQGGRNSVRRRETGYLANLTNPASTTALEFDLRDCSAMMCLGELLGSSKTDVVAMAARSRIAHLRQALSPNRVPLW